MIVDARPLQPEFVPGDVVHRAGEIEALTAALDPVTRGQPAETALLYGPSGTGKTCIARHTVEKLREEVIDIETQYVNCWEDYSKFKVLYRLLEEIGQTIDVHRQSTPTDLVLDRLRNRDETPYVAVLDEVDQLSDKGVLYDLNRMPRLELVLVANSDQDLLVQVDDRLTSRLQTASRIRFGRYGTTELVSILEDRVRWGLEKDVVSDEHLRAIAEMAAGDARVAIGTLRAAARLADHRSLDRITDEVIREGEPEAKAEIRQRSEGKLTPDQQILYDIISEAGEIDPGPLYEEYRSRVDDPQTERTLRNHLQKMRRYNLIAAEGEGRGRYYEAIE